MASIFDIPFREVGGPEALRAFEYQHLVTVGKLLDLWLEPDLELLEIESHDDILVRRVDSGRTIAEYIQVKSNGGSLWTLSDLFSSENGSRKGKGNPSNSSSIVAKQIRRAVGDEDARFRIVTRSETNRELSLLKRSFDLRDVQKMAELTGKLSERLAEISRENIEYWIGNVIWEVAGDEGAINHENFTKIGKVVFALCGRAITPDQIHALHDSLLEFVRRAAIEADNRQCKRCDRDQLKHWIRDYCSRVPLHHPPSRVRLLEDFERKSYERCKGRWVFAGLGEDLAERLASDEAIGASSRRWLQGLDEDFIWIRGPFGVGKSLAMDSAYREALVAYREGRVDLIPIFIEAKNLVGSFDVEVENCSKDLADHFGQGVVVYIDGADEGTHQRARDLIQDAWNYSRANKGSKVIVASTNLELRGVFSKEIPTLSEEEARYFAMRLGQSPWSYGELHRRFAADMSNPFFIIQRMRFGTELSRAELVREMVSAALEKVDVAVQSAEEMLAEMAKWQLDNGSPLIPERVLNRKRKSVAAVLETRLLERRGEFFVFTVECVVQSFAAQAIELGLVSIEEILQDLKRLDRWQFAIAMALSRVSSSDEADNLIKSIALSQPAFASLIIADALVHRFGKNDLVVSAEEASSEIYKCSNIWKDACEPVSGWHQVFPVREDGSLLKLSVTCKGNQIFGVWHDCPDLPQIGTADLFGKTSEEGKGRIFWMTHAPDHPAWAWFLTRGQVMGCLEGLVSIKGLAMLNRELLRERAWSEACGLIGESSIECNFVDLDKLGKSRSYRWSYYKGGPLEYWIQEELRPKGESVFVAPYPQADNLEGAVKMWQLFSLQRMVERANSIFQSAIIAYKDLVEFLFPSMAVRLPMYAGLPYEITGVIYLDPGHGFGVDYWVIPTSENESVVKFIGGTQDEAENYWTEMHHEEKSHPERMPWGRVFGVKSSLELWDAESVVQLVHSWIKSDLQAVGLLRHGS